MVALLKQKNIAAFTSLYDKYAPALYTVVLQIVRNKEVADNLLKKVFIIIWNKVDEYDPARSTLFIWMLQITRSASLDQIKHMGGQTIVQNLTLDKEDASFTSNPAIDNYGIKKVIHQLKEDERIILSLYFYKGYSISQIEESLCLSENLIRAKIKTALQEIRSLLSRKK